MANVPVVKSAAADAAQPTPRAVKFIPMERVRELSKIIEKERDALFRRLAK